LLRALVAYGILNSDRFTLTLIGEFLRRGVVLHMESGGIIENAGDMLGVASNDLEADRLRFVNLFNREVRRPKSTGSPLPALIPVIVCEGWEGLSGNKSIIMQNKTPTFFKFRNSTAN
jgi:hypothetical protein